MSLQQHEKWIKENIGQAQVDINSQELWNDLKNQLPNEKKDRKGIFLFLFGLGFITICLGGLIYFYSIIDRDNSESHDFANSINENIIDCTIDDEEISKTLHSNSDHERYIKQQQVIDDLEKEKTAASRTIGLAVNNIDNNEAIHVLKNASSIFKQDLEKVKTSEFLKEEISKTASTFNNERNEKSLYGTMLLSNQNSFYSIDLLDYALPVLEPSINEKRSKWKLGLFTGANIATYEYDFIPMDLRENYKNSTVNLSGYSSALNVYYSLNNKWSFIGGINYSQIVTRFSFAYQEIEISTIDGIEKIIIDVDGVANTISGEITQNTIIQTSGKWHMKDNLVEMNVGSEYALWTKNRLRATVGLGMNVPLYNYINGSALAYDDERLFIQTISESKSIIGNIDPYGSVDFYYKLTPNVNIGIKGSYILKHNTNYNSIPNFKRTRYAVGLSMTRVLNF
jgi:hypothetical protein